MTKRERNLQVLNMLDSSEWSTFMLLIAVTAFVGVFFRIDLKLSVIAGTIIASVYLGVVTHKLKKFLESEEI